MLRPSIATTIAFRVGVLQTLLLTVPGRHRGLQRAHDVEGIETVGDEDSPGCRDKGRQRVGKPAERNVVARTRVQHRVVHLARVVDGGRRDNEGVRAIVHRVEIVLEGGDHGAVVDGLVDHDVQPVHRAVRPLPGQDLTRVVAEGVPTPQSSPPGQVWSGEELDEVPQIERRPCTVLAVDLSVPKTELTHVWQSLQKWARHLTPDELARGRVVRGTLTEEAVAESNAFRRNSWGGDHCGEARQLTLPLRGSLLVNDIVQQLQTSEERPDSQRRVWSQCSAPPWRTRTTCCGGVVIRTRSSSSHRVQRIQERNAQNEGGSLSEILSKSPPARMTARERANQLCPRFCENGLVVVPGPLHVARGAASVDRTNSPEIRDQTEEVRTLMLSDLSADHRSRSHKRRSVWGRRPVPITPLQTSPRMLPNVCDDPPTQLV